jgi:hypothetical protein
MVKSAVLLPGRNSGQRWEISSWLASNVVTTDGEPSGSRDPREA